MKINKYALLLVGGLLAGIVTSYLFTCHQAPAHQRPQDIRNEVKKNEAAFIKRISAVQSEEKKTTLNLAATKGKLEQTTAHKAVLYQTLKEVVVSNVADTFISVVNKSDSLFRQVIHQQDTLLQIKDTLLAVHQSAYTSLRASFDQSWQQQEALLQANKQLTKDLKKQRRKTKLVAVSSLLVTGLMAGYLISR
jgi:hypothetical protein